MPDQPDVPRIDVELRRVVARLESLPVTKIEDGVAQLVQSAAAGIVDHTPDPYRPSDAVIPFVGPTALAAVISVAVRDYLDMRTAASNDAAVAQTLTQLRRSLP